MIDGGKGQLSSGVQALDQFIERGVVVVSLAKRLEEIYVPGRSGPIVLPRDSRALQLLQRIRDEAHRFAIEHHRVRRDPMRFGPGRAARRRPGAQAHPAPLSARPSGSWAPRRRSSRAVPGLPGKVARQIHEQLHRIG